MTNNNDKSNKPINSSRTRTTTNKFNKNTNNEDKQMTKAMNQSTNQKNCTN